MNFEILNQLLGLPKADPTPIGHRGGITLPVPGYDLPPGYRAERSDPSQRIVRDPGGKLVLNPRYHAEIRGFNPNYAGIAGDLSIPVAAGLGALGPAGAAIGGLIGAAGGAIRELNGPKE